MGPTDDQAARHGPRSNDASIYCSQSCNPVRCVLKRDTPTMSPEASGSLGSSLETRTMHAEKLLKTVMAHITRHMGNGYWAIGQAEPEQCGHPSNPSLTLLRLPSSHIPKNSDTSLGDACECETLPCQRDDMSSLQGWNRCQFCVKKSGW